MKIPFSQPVVLPQTLERIGEALKQGQLSGVGPLTSRCEALLKERMGATNLLVTSATHALEMMGLLLEIQPGDEVIVPSFTFVSTANAFALRGARIRFADNDEYGNISLKEVERLRSPRTKAVVAVHYAGNSADMDALKAMCSALGIALLEDAAQAIGSTYKGKALGTFGALACLSFHDTKNICAGEGGSLILNQNAYLERAEIIREKGTNRRRFFQGLADKYTWVDIGSSYALSELNVAYLLPQLEQLDSINAKRNGLWKTYDAELSKGFEKIGVQVLRNPSYNDRPNAHMFAVVLKDGSMRTGFISFMRERQITTPFHYVSLHTAPHGLKVSGQAAPESLPQCERLSSCLVRLPLFHNMTEEQQSRVVDAAREWQRSQM